MYFLKRKSEVLCTFKKFKALVENGSGHNINAMRSYKGAEFTSKKFEEYFENHWIHWPSMVPYSPQQNGVAERKNITIIDIA